MKSYSDILKKHGVSPSHQRVKILEFLDNNKTHPVVDNIFQALHQELPTLSKTTVYNTLKLFVKKNLAQMVTIEENEVRYDGDTSTHGHFKCEQCDSIFDFTYSNEMKPEGLEGFEIKSQHLFIRGICKECKKKYK